MCWNSVSFLLLLTCNVWPSVSSLALLSFELNKPIWFLSSLVWKWNTLFLPFAHLTFKQSPLKSELNQFLYSHINRQGLVGEFTSSISPLLPEHQLYMHFITWYWLRVQQGSVLFFKSCFFLPVLGTGQLLLIHAQVHGLFLQPSPVWY